MHKRADRRGWRPLTLLLSYAGGASVALFIWADVLLPVAAILLDSACILCMDLHGC